MLLETVGDDQAILQTPHASHNHDLYLADFTLLRKPFGPKLHELMRQLIQNPHALAQMMRLREAEIRAPSSPKAYRHIQ